MFETVEVGEARHRLPRGRTAPVRPLVIAHRPGAQGPLPKSRTTEQSHDFSIAPTRKVTVTRIVCGVDVASRTLEARMGREGASACFANDLEGIMALGDFCRQHGADLVAMEATGGYEQQALGLLSGQGLGVAILNPRAVRQFAQAMGLLEKTDTIDSGVIAWYAEVKNCQPGAPTPAGQQKLRALVTRLRQLTEVRTAERNQARLVTEPEVLAQFARLLALIEEQIEQLAASIAALIGEDPLWRELDAAFRSIKGVADRTVARLMAELPEIGTLSNKAISKLAGLAPLACDSGQYQGKRAIRGGRPAVREILYMAAGVAGLYEPDFVSFHKRLKQAGKPGKVVRIALAHKLLVRLNAKAREARQRLTTSQPQLVPA
jgi:transposase